MHPRLKWGSGREVIYLKSETRWSRKQERGWVLQNWPVQERSHPTRFTPLRPSDFPTLCLGKYADDGIWLLTFLGISVGRKHQFGSHILPFLLRNRDTPTKTGPMETVQVFWLIFLRTSRISEMRTPPLYIFDQILQSRPENESVGSRLSSGSMFWTCLVTLACDFIELKLHTKTRSGYCW